MYESGRPLWGMSIGGMPEVVVIRCPACHAAASFESGFLFIHKDDVHRFPPRDGRRRVQWGSHLLEERFPHELPWSDPENPFTRVSRSHVHRVCGVATCPSCGRRAKHVLAWPADAYYRCETSEGVLWAWDRPHLVALRAYLASDDRNPGAHGPFARFLRHVPKQFLRVNRREPIVKHLDRRLARGD